MVPINNSFSRNWLLPFFLLFSCVLAAQENCANGIDDDADGLIDLNDPQCVCGATNSIPSLIPNPSFEVFTGCPSSFSELFRATPWIQATMATSDYFNTCGFIMPSIYALNLNDFPHGDGVAGTLFIGDWAEYLGAPLQSPMLAGTNYQMTFSVAGLTTRGDGTYDGTPVSDFEPVNITLYGCADGTNLPLDITTCPSTSDFTWVVIGSATYTPASVWSQVTMTFTPSFNVNAIMLGAPPVLPGSYPASSVPFAYPYFLYDNLLLNEASAFGVNISQAGTFCTSNLVLTANITTDLSSNATYQWYRNGVAIGGATSGTYSISTVPDNLGQYSVRVTDGTTCYLSSSITVDNTVPGPEATVVQPTCVVITGVITIVTPAAQYSFDNGATWQNSPTKSGLPVGNYFVKIKTANGCISAVTGVAVVAPQMLSSGNVTVTQPETCDETGSITVTAPNAAEYSYDNGVTWTTESSVAGLAVGTYDVIIKDVDGCQSGAQAVQIFEAFADAPLYEMVQPTCSPSGSITITSDASLYSFDDGVTWTTNNTATGLAEGTYMIKIIDLSGCESSTTYIFLYADSVPGPAYQVVQPSCEALGSIAITTASSEYSFDDGLTWTTNNELTGLDPGFYWIKIKDANGCPSWSEGIYLNEPYLLTPDYTITHPFCTETTGMITITPSTNYTYSFDGGITYQSLNSSGPLLPGSYVVKVKSNFDCTSAPLYLYISDPTGIPPSPSGEASQLFCVFNNPTVDDLVAQGTSIQWYISPADMTPLPADTPLIDGYTYYATQTRSNTCESPTRLEVSVAIIQYDLPVQNYSLLVCDDLNDQNESVDLSDYLSSIVPNPSDYQFSYYTTFASADGPVAADIVSNANSYPLAMGPNIVYVRVVAPNGCWKVAKLTLTMIQSPYNNMQRSFVLCEDTIITLAAPSGFQGYLWSTGQTTRTITINEPGSYWVTVAENHGGVICTTTTNITVTLSNAPTITLVETIDWTDSNNTIAVHLSADGVGDYEYSIDGSNFQTSNEFTGLEPGTYTIFVKDRNECGDDFEEVYLLMYPRFFTPNDDSFNDVWHVKFSKFEPGMKILIYDRYGKLVKELSPQGPGWDGTLNGLKLPSTDYWFSVQRENGKQHLGHFSMKR
ncbi:MAG TPA: T9SS type B sorting domain-containing protein [Flavobacterium sp.]|jgi:gliding motility-associated-like protein